MRRENRSRKRGREKEKFREERREEFQDINRQNREVEAPGISFLKGNYANQECQGNNASSLWILSYDPLCRAYLPSHANYRHRHRSRLHCRLHSPLETETTISTETTQG